MPEAPVLSVRIVTLFPDVFGPFLSLGVVGTAVRSGVVDVGFELLREHGIGRHRSVDDTPYGGGSGMVLRVDCVVAALEAAEVGGPRRHRVLLTPQGRRFRQPVARELIEAGPMTLVCGRYEGFDERVREFVDAELSIGDFVLAGGEVAAMAIVEACARLLPGVLGNEASTLEESFSPEHAGMLEYPQYTRPAQFRGLGVPDVLRGGDHGKIAAFRRDEAAQRTRARRPDLLSVAARAGEGES